MRRRVYIGDFHLGEDEKKAVKYDLYYSSCELLLVILYIYKLVYLYKNKNIIK